jgi:hypothetical protein
MLGRDYKITPPAEAPKLLEVGLMEAAACSAIRRSSAPVMAPATPMPPTTAPSTTTGSPPAMRARPGDKTSGFSSIVRFVGCQVQRHIPHPFIAWRSA